MDIKAHHEFGFILWYHAPVAYDAHLKGLLKSTESKVGSKPVFYFSENHVEVAKDNVIFNQWKECYGINRPTFTKTNWTPPPYKEFYKNDKFVFDKPILTINNKSNKEWGNSGIFNYFTSKSLGDIILEFKDDYQIIYIRPPNNNKFSYQKDKQENIDIGDIEVIRKHDIIWICDLLEENDLSYNELQFMLLANSDRHITCSGDAVIPAYFGGDILMYNCPSCNSSRRGVWSTNSWLGLLSNAKIHGFNDYNQLLNKAKVLWK